MSMETVNIPIQMICCCSTLGEFTPLRFRFETEEHELITVQVDSVLAHKETSFAGIREIQYTCSAIIGSQQKLFILKYNVTSHKWVMFKLLT